LKQKKCCYQSFFIFERTFSINHAGDACRFYEIFTIFFFFQVLAIIDQARSKIVWQVKPNPVQIVNENDSVQLSCEFKDTSPADTIQSPQSPNYFVIWYKDGASSNVLSLNDKLANLNNTQYEIRGKYNLVIRNATKKDSGLYTCQLFQSTELVASVNLTVLGESKGLGK